MGSEPDKRVAQNRPPVRLTGQEASWTGRAEHGPPLCMRWGGRRRWAMGKVRWLSMPYAAAGRSTAGADYESNRSVISVYTESQ